MKKIMFNDRYGLTQAVLDGRKTMTRRIAMSLNHPNISDISEWGIGGNGKAMLTITYDAELQEDVYPCYQIGEVVAVAQPYKDTDVLTFNAYDNDGQPRKDGRKRHEEMLKSAGYRNKMFVKAEWMPHRIRITNIKVERLQDISDEDCMKEGIMEGGREAFATLIDRISGKGTWERNPWVFAYEFILEK